MLGLLINLEPARDESLYGYLHRLGHANGLTGTEVVALFRSARSELIEEWLRDASLPASWRLLSEEIRHPKTNPMKLWSLRHRKHCPFCLDESLYWRDLWDLTLAVACPWHECLLQDSCSACGTHFKSDVMATLRCCECGKSVIISGNKATAEREALWITSELRNRLHSRPRDTYPLSQLALEDFHDLTRRFGARASNPDCAKPLKVADVGAMAISTPIAVAAGRVLMDWPNGFWTFLSQLEMDQQARPRWKLASVFGPTYTDIHKALDRASFDFLRMEFDRYVQSLWEGPLAQRNRYLHKDTITQHRWVSLRTAAKATDLTPALLHRMISAGELPKRAMSYPSGRSGLVVDSSDVHNRAEQLKSALSLEETAALLKISKDRVRQLLQGGLIRFFGGKPSLGERWWIDSASLDKLGKALPCSSNIDGLTSISQLAKLQLPSGGGLIELLGLIQSGAVTAYFADAADRTAIGHWLVPWSCAATPQRDGATNKAKHHSVVEAASLLGVKQEVAYALVRNGVLQIVSVKCGRRNVKFVTDEAIDVFNRDYILSPELSKLCGISSKWLPSFMSDHRCFPVVGPNVKGAECRQYVWPRGQANTC